MPFRLTCPCGEVLHGREEDDLVHAATSHLDAQHGRSYSREDIMFMAITIPERLMPPDA
jgi:hypothetical protein